MIGSQAVIFAPEKIRWTIWEVFQSRLNKSDWETGTSEYGDGHSYCEIYSIESSPIKIGLDMTYSSWDSSYFNWDVGIIEYKTVSFQVPSFKKL